MSTVKLSDWWDALLEKKNPDGVTVIQIDTEYLPEIRMRMKSLESEVQRLKEKASKWDAFRESIREHKCKYGGICVEKIGVESRLAKAQEISADFPWWIDFSLRPEILKQWRNELETTLGAGGEDEK